MKHTHTEGPDSILKSRFARGLFPLMAALLACALVAPEARAAVAKTDFAKKMTLTPSETALAKIGETAWADFPVLVRLPAEVSEQLQSANGTDLFFTDENDASLPFEVETFNPAGTTFVWVKVPSLSSATELTAYFGGAANDGNNPTAVWTRYAAVIHGGDSITNSVANGPAATAGSTAVEASVTAGKIGGGIHKGTPNAIGVNVAKPSDALANTGKYSVSAWFKRDGNGGGNKGTHILAASRSGWNSGTGFLLLQEQGKYISIAAAGSHQWSSGSYALADGVWGHVAFAYESGVSLTSYFNGVQDQTKASPGNLVSTAATWTFGSYQNAASNDSFKGDMDELRIFNGVASDGWIALEYATMADAAFFDYGAVAPTDATAPSVGVPVVTRDAGGAFTVTAEISDNVPTAVFCDADGVTNAMATVDAALPMTYSATLVGLAADTTYACVVGAGSTGGTVTTKTCPTAFYNGDLTVETISDAVENGLVPGVFCISRADTAHDLAVAYSVGGTATAGQTYEALTGTVTIPAGAASVDVQIVPLLDPQTTSDTTVSITLDAGLYGIDSQHGSAELTVVNLVAPTGYNTWISSSNSLASINCNWSEGHAPTSSENVLFDGRFSTANCEWDSAASATVASWTQTNAYTGVVTLDTVYPGKGEFQCLTVTGPMAIDCGTITHPQSRTQWDSAANCLQDLLENETYRVRIDAGSLVVGVNGRIDARNKGYYHANTGSHTSPQPAHGGRLSVYSQDPYDNVKEPIHIGMPYKPATGNYTVGIGGGAIYLTSAGAIVVDGFIGADTGSDTWGRGYTLRAGAAAGSVYVRGASVTGTGTISASALKTDEQGNRGVGGRVAVIATSSTPIDYSTLQLKATVYPFKNDGGQSSTYGGCGTVYVKDGTMTNGVLIVRNFDLTYTDGNPGRRTDVTADCDWTFDRLELGGGVQLAVPYGTTLTLPGWDCVTAPYNASGVPSGLYYRGGTLDFGSASDVTLSGRWHFAPVSNYVFNANVTLADVAQIGFGGKYTQNIANYAYPDKLDKIQCTVNGNLTIPYGCSVNVNLAGAMQDSHYVPDGYPQGAHGGRRSNTMATIGSVFHPRTLPHGQSNSYGHIIPGGAVELSVSGTFTLGGTIESTAYTGNDGTKSEVGGGSIDITAGRLAGDGSIKAGAVKDGQPGGRIAIRLTGAGATLDDFDGTINCATMGANSVGSCGSVYIQTAADGEGRGTIVLDDNGVTCTTYTPICATGYAADDIADFRRANLVVRNQAKAQVMAADANNSFRMGSIEVDSTGMLDLLGHVFVVKSAKFGDVTLPPGSYAAGSTLAIGDKTLADYLVDTADGGGGSLVVTGGGFFLIVR